MLDSLWPFVIPVLSYKKEPKNFRALPGLAGVLLRQLGNWARGYLSIRHTAIQTSVAELTGCFAGNFVSIEVRRAPLYFVYSKRGSR